MFSTVANTGLSKTTSYKVVLPFYLYAAIAFLSAITFRNRGFLSFSNFGEMLTMASSDSGLYFNKADIFVLALIVMIIRYIMSTGDPPL